MATPQVTGDTVSTAVDCATPPGNAGTAPKPPLPVTKAGVAADRADFSQVVDTVPSGRQLEFVDKRSSVVLYVIDSEVEPTRECIDTISAIAQATGRVAVGFIGSGEFASMWRQHVDGTIPMGNLDQRMARTLALLAEGPPRPAGESPVARRARCIRAHLAQERSRSAGAAAHLQRELQQGSDAHIKNALQRLAEVPVNNAVEMHEYADAAAAELSARCNEELGLHIDVAVPVPEAPSRPSLFTNGAKVAAAVGIAVGCFRITLMSLAWIGVTPQVATGVGIAVGLTVALGIVLATIRRNARQRTALWRANYLAQLRRGWQQAAELAVRETIGARGSGWRIRQLAEHAGISNR